MAAQGGCGQLHVALDHDKAGYLERCLCCCAPLPSPYGEALEGRFEYYGLPPRDQVYGINVCAGLAIGFGCVL